MHDPAAEDFEPIVTAFAPYFVESSPSGVFGGANDAAFRQMIPKGFARYRAVGGRHMIVTHVDVTRLDDLHAIAHVDWDFGYLNKDGNSGNVRFRNLYFVTIASGEPRIFAYVTPDEETAMKAHGLV
ncbi:hypothetical protein VW29_12905 [Devosia limi DSM 17137]|uniref:SnoaL-like domain-containing protein n=1 Tax=Devosia limi DSM 17137 TaxID=1121477 RepID=A0A0F5LNJ5_9HYPH|nr:hypothetical protein VW29_12905 [Devosia limi DSM 17137]